jgi:hypothetical protein
MLAVLLMPLGMSPSAAATHQEKSTASMAMGHCDAPAPEHPIKQGIADCTMACSAALPAIMAPGEPPALRASAPAVVASVRALHGLHPETITPPPKRA